MARGRGLLHYLGANVNAIVDVARFHIQFGDGLNIIGNKCNDLTSSLLFLPVTGQPLFMEELVSQNKLVI